MPGQSAGPVSARQSPGGALSGGIPPDVMRGGALQTACLGGFVPAVQSRRFPASKDAGSRLPSGSRSAATAGPAAWGGTVPDC